MGFIAPPLEKISSSALGDSGVSEEFYKSSTNSSTVNLASLIIDLNVPFAISL